MIDRSYTPHVSDIERFRALCCLFAMMRALAAATAAILASAQYNYTYGPGFLAAGDDLISGPFTYDEAVAYCSSQALCMGFTFNLGSQNCECGRKVARLPARPYSSCLALHPYSHNAS